MVSSTTLLLYVSNSLLGARASEDISQILSTARSRNVTLGVTGALIFTGAHFAQALEGEASAIDELMLSIMADPRHERIDVVRAGEQAQRKFAGWSMAYSGPSVFVEQRVVMLAKSEPNSRARNTASRALVKLMQEFSAVGGVAGA